MPAAELIAIGTELLLGEIQDTNTHYLTRQLRHLGIDVFRATLIGDNPLRIAEVIRESLSRSDIVITTGGLGPTVDDPTRNAAALAFNVDVEFHPELWKQISSRFLRRGVQPSDNNKKQALLPIGALPLPNPVGTAPAFYMNQNPGILICLPGVPPEMETIFQSSVIPLLRQLCGLSEIIKARVLHTCGMGESNVDTLIDDLETLSNPTVGLCAHPGIVDIRITAKADSEPAADKMLDSLEREIRNRLPQVIFGMDDLTLSQAVESLANRFKQTILIIFDGFPSDLERKINFSLSDYITVKDKNSLPVDSFLIGDGYTTRFQVSIARNQEVATLSLQYTYQSKSITEQRGYSGPPSMTETWAINTSLGFLWKRLSELDPGENNEKS